MTEKKPARLTPKKIYLKDASFESPGTPNIFLKTAINPDIDMNLNVSHSAVDENDRFYEVVLKITVTASLEGKNMFLVEVHQAGMFEIVAEDPKQREILVQVGCPHTLLPFAREEVASLVSKGGYQQMLIAPVNFEAIYLKKLEQEASENPPQEAH